MKNSDSANFQGIFIIPMFLDSVFKHKKDPIKNIFNSRWRVYYQIY